MFFFLCCETNNIKATPQLKSLKEGDVEQGHCAPVANINKGEVNLNKFR